MHRMDVKKQILGLEIDIDSIADQNTRIIIRQLLNIIEMQSHEIEKLKIDNQKLRDENNHLKGEQGQPSLRKQSKKNKDESSEAERGAGDEKKEPKKKKEKKSKLVIHQTQKCEIDPAQMPADVVFKGYQPSVVQDIIIRANNTLFNRAIYYSPSLKKTFIAALPEGYAGDFGPSIKALIVDMHHSGKMTESAIHHFLTNHDIDIAKSSISRILTDKHDNFHKEKKDIMKAGIQSTPYQQMDDTGARVNGINYYTHILCNAFYTAFFTRKNKTRFNTNGLSIIGRAHTKNKRQKRAIVTGIRPSNVTFA
jgi:hypothetical protein